MVTATTLYTTSGTPFGDGVSTDFHLMAFSAAGAFLLAVVLSARRSSPPRAPRAISIARGQSPGGPCGAKTCKPLRTYDTGDGGAEGSAAISGNMVFATTQASPDPNTIGVVAAYPAAGCGKPRCEPLWTGINFTSGFASPPSVANGVVFVGKGPATATPQNTPDAGLYAFKAAGCGAVTSRRISSAPISPPESDTGSQQLRPPVSVGPDRTAGRDAGGIGTARLSPLVT